MINGNYDKFDVQYRGTPRPIEALVNTQQPGATAFTTALPAIVTQLSADVTGWSGNPTTAQVALAVTDARGIAEALERLHGVVHQTRKGA